MSEQPKDISESVPGQDAVAPADQQAAPAESVAVEAEPSVASRSVGTALRAAREAQKLSLADVSGRIKFTEKQIVALETDDYGSLPEGAFLRGLVRSYARALQLDEAPLVAALPQPVAPVAPVPEEAAQPVRLKGSGVAISDRTKLVIGMVAGLAVVAGIALNLPTKKQETAPQSSEVVLPIPAVAVEPPAASSVSAPETAVEPQPQAVPVAPAETTPPAPAAPAKVEAAPVAVPAVVVKPQAAAPAPTAKADVKESAQPGGDLRLVFDDMSWTEVRDGKGNILLSQRNHPGTEKVLSGAPPFNLVVGNAKSVHLYFRGKEVPLATTPGGSVARLKLE
jgi:cytoskeleton protein RodZ